MSKREIHFSHFLEVCLGKIWLLLPNFTTENHSQKLLPVCKGGFRGGPALFIREAGGILAKFLSKTFPIRNKHTLNSLYKGTQIDSKMLQKL